MKRLFISLAILAGISLSSCNDSFLEKTPVTDLTENNAFNSYDNFKAFMWPCYEMFTNNTIRTSLQGFGQDGQYKGDMAAGYFQQKYESGYNEFAYQTVASVASGNGWDFKSFIRRVNIMLSHIDNSSMTEAQKDHWRAVGYFFHSFWYMELIDRFGDVPWVDRPLGSDEEELYEGRDPRESVMEKVMEDVDFAIANLPEVQNVYRVTRWTARALKSRIALFEGTFRKYHGLDGYEEFLQACVNASEPFLTGPYSIYTSGSTPYQDLFTSQNAIGTEIILARAYTSAISGMTHDVNGHLTGATMGRPGMTRNVVNMYLMRDGSRYTDQADYATKTFVEECKNRDLRMAQTLRTPGYKRIGGSKELAPDLSRSTTGYQLIKYLTEERYDANKASTNDMPLFRLAEVLLNYAEAKAELGTLKQADLDNTIRPLRVRAGLPDLDMEEANAHPDPYLSSSETGYANVTGANKGVILEIRRERTLETPMEGLRYWDIMRWKEGKRFEKPIEGLYFPGTGEYDLDGNGSVDVCIYDTEKAPGNSADVLYLKLGSDIVLSGETSGNVLAHSAQQRIWNEERDYLYPIPTDDRVLTQGAISQNPGWNDGLPF